MFVIYASGLGIHRLVVRNTSQLVPQRNKKGATISRAQTHARYFCFHIPIRRHEPESVRTQQQQPQLQRQKETARASEERARPTDEQIDRPT